MPIPDQQTWEHWVFKGPEPDFEQLVDEAGRLVSWPLKYATALFSAPRHLPASYTERQLRIGFGRLPRGWNLAELLWESDQSRADQVACFASMVPLYEHFFIGHPLDTTAFMWWDSLRPTPTVEVDSTLTLAAIASLEAILHLPSEACAYAALHGLGHIHHPRKIHVVQVFMSRSKGISPDLLTYAKQSVEGQVL